MYTCTDGSWTFSKDCQTTSCHEQSCGECLNLETKCIETSGDDNVYTCKSGMFEFTKKCEYDCLDDQCVEPKIYCMDGEDYQSLRVSDTETVQAYCIKDENDLRNFRDAINAGNAYPDAKNTANAYILSRDLSMNDTTWEPIGNKDKPFVGVFYGNDKKITFENDLIYVYDESKTAGTISDSGSGLFGTVQNSNIFDLSVKIAYSFVDNSDYFVEVIGGLSGYVYDSQISNITTSFKIFPASKLKVYHSQGGIGGVVGYMQNSTIKDSMSEVDIIINGSAIGGIVGTGQSIKINKTHTTGRILASSYIGGICGACYHKPEYTESVIENSYSDLIISDIVDYPYNLAESYFQAAGGIVGNNITSIKISHCYSTGVIFSTQGKGIGGLIGASNSVSIDHSYYIGELSGALYLGGIVGVSKDLNASNNISYCFSILNTVDWASEYTSGIIGQFDMSAQNEHSDSSEFSHNYSLSVSSKRPKYGLVQSIRTSENTTTQLSLLSNYYTDGVTTVVGTDSEKVVEQNSNAVKFVETGTNIYTAKTGEVVLKDELGTGWKSYRCVMYIGNGEKNYIIPISTDNVPSFCSLVEN